MLSAKAKEAIKTGLAFALVYGIALKLDWTNPSWAGFSVAMIALPTAGQSIHKGVLRMAGTIPGCLAGLVILSLAAQSRWVFLLLLCAAALGQALQAEGSESYEVHEPRSVWEEFQGLSASVMESLDRWQTGLARLAQVDVSRALPDLRSFFDEVAERFEQLQRVLGGSPPGQEPREVSLHVDHDALRGLSYLERAALSVTKTELVMIAPTGGIDDDAMRAALDACVGNSDDAMTPMLRLARKIGPDSRTERQPAGCGLQKPTRR